MKLEKKIDFIEYRLYFNEQCMLLPGFFRQHMEDFFLLHFVIGSNRLKLRTESRIILFIFLHSFLKIQPFIPTA